MKLVRRHSLALLLTAFAGMSAGQAQTIWTMPTEYPATSMPGEGLAAFAAAIAQRSGGRLTIRPSYDAALGLKSAQIPAAVAAGKAEAGDAFGGAMLKEGAAFGLPSLPFVATSVDEARRLADIARPLYAKSLDALGLRLLYVTPWPPTGIWSKTPLASASGLDGLAIRTYDATSTDVLNNAGAKAVNLSFADLMPKLKDGSVVAVLSSGDGGAGRRLWEFLPHFTAANYAMPLSFAFVRKNAYEALPFDLRTAVDEAGRETEARQWATIRDRLAKNYEVMRRNGVQIAATAPPDVIVRLKRAAEPVVAKWLAGVGPDGQNALAAFARK
jgi:TRAP-type C4-dicarboxylate transport system substrate-binding protein